MPHWRIITVMMRRVRLRLARITRLMESKTLSKCVVLWFKTCVFTDIGFSARFAAARGPG